MDQRDFEFFVDNACHTIADMWQRSPGPGEGLSHEDLYELNDLLTAFFVTKADIEAKPRSMFSV